MPSSHLYLFGPQTPGLSSDSLLKVSTRLRDSVELAPLARGVSTITQHWKSVQSSFPQLAAHSAIRQLQALEQLSTNPQRSSQLEGPRCLFDSCVTVLLQAIHILDLDKAADFQILSKPAVARKTSFQGFCIGLLSALTTAASSSRADYIDRVYSALLCAACIGSIVDKDQEAHTRDGAKAETISVRRVASVSLAQVEELLKQYPDCYISCITDASTITVTATSKILESLLENLHRIGCITRVIGLRGRFHSAAHKSAIQELSKLAKENPLFSLETKSVACLGVRTNCSTVLLAENQLEKVFTSILGLTADWKTTVIESILSFGNVQPQLVSVGAQNCIPRLALASSANTMNNHQTNGVLANGTSSNSDSGSSTPVKITHMNGDHLDGLVSEVNDQPRMSTQYQKIAVIGMGGRFAKADNLGLLWERLCAGQNSVGRVPEQRFKSSELEREPKGPFWGNFLEEPDRFDHKFFGLTAREAKSMDPQQRILLEVAYETLSSAGYFCRSRDAATDKNIGCYVGVGSVDYDVNVASHDAGAFSATGTLRAFVSGKVSHHFGWTGPSITCDTACSSSAVALHSACMALQMGECSEALAGGVNVITNPALYQNLAAASFLSPSGASKAFDASADGYCRGEGAGLVLLKPYDRALADGDDIIGVISGSAVNQGSNCSPITVPDSDSQRELYLSALARGHVSASDVTYVECHGTGTPVGDPIEYESVQKTFVSKTRQDPVFVGSIKDAIGHCEGASGIAGVLKVLLMMKHRMIPKQANFVSLSPRIKTSLQDRIEIPTKTQPWNGSNLKALVNNYGAAGSNAAILLEQVPDDGVSAKNKMMSSAKLIELPFCVTGKTSEAVANYCQALRTLLLTSVQANRQIDLSNLARRVCSSQNPTHEYIWSGVASSVSSLTEILRDATGSHISKKSSSKPKPTILFFPGQNGRNVNLDENFVNSYPLFKKYLVECDVAMKRLGLPRLFPRIFDSSSYEDLVALHCSLFAIQYSSAMSWIKSGIHVDRMIGHSFGQLTAMCVSGCMTLEDAAKLVATRARLITERLGQRNGSMLSVECGQPQLDQLLADVATTSGIDVACHNSPRNVVLAGSDHAIENLESSIAASASASSFKLTRLKNSHAYHSHIMEQIAPELLKVAQTIEFSDMEIPIETCTKGNSWGSFDAKRIVEHSRYTVYFSEAVQRIHSRHGASVWIDVGTASPLGVMIQRTLGDKSATDDVVLNADFGLQNKAKTLARMVTSMWNHSIPAKDWSFSSAQCSGEWVDLCPYPFEKSRSWLDFVINHAKPSAPVAPAQPAGLLTPVQQTGPNSPTISLLVNNLNETFQVCTKGHAVLQQSLCPASMYTEMIAESVKHVSDGDPHVLQIQDLSITKPLGLSSTSSTYLQLTKSTSSTGSWDFQLATQAQGTSSTASNATGRIKVYEKSNKDEVDRLLTTFRRLVTWNRASSILVSPESETMNGRFIYKAFGEVVDYAPYYQGVVEFAATEHEAVGRVRLPASPIRDPRKVLTNPIALDNFLQVAGVHINCWRSRNKSEVFMCTEVQDVYLDHQYLENASTDMEWLVYACLDVVTAKEVEYDIFVLSARTKALTCVFKGVRFFSVNIMAMGKILARNNDQSADTLPAQTSSPQVLESRKTAPEVHSKIAASEPSSATEPVLDKTTKEAPPSRVFEDLQSMLSETMEIESSDIGRKTDLAELGIDSLMVTEVLGEISKRFSTTISMEQFQTLTTVQDLCDVISPSTASAADESEEVMPREEIESHPQTLPDATAIANKRDEIVDKAQQAFYSVNKNIDKLMEETRFAKFYQSVYPLQSELVTRYVVEAFTALGYPLDRMQPGDQVPAFKHLPQHRKVVRQIQLILVDSGLLSHDEASQGFVRTSKSVPADPASPLQREVLDSFPQHLSEHQLLQTTAEHLADCLTGARNPTSLIFGSAKARAVLSDVYANAPMFKAGTILLAKYLQDLLSNIDRSQEINILEIGAGTGGTTSLLLEALAKLDCKFTYTFTDLSSSLVVAAKKKFQAYPFMRYQTFNIEVEPPAELLNTYDIVISTNCVHATKNLVESTSTINKILRPDGILCLVELTRNLFWFDLVFGLLEGWWLFNDGREHVLASEYLWEETLKKAGYNWVAWSQGQSDESNVLRVITASPSAGDDTLVKENKVSPRQKHKQIDSFPYKRVDGLELYADVHYPDESKGPLPVALMIHGGGHVLLSRKSFGAEQIRIVVDAGFIAVSVDYRLCPESTLPQGAMTDVRDAVEWIRSSLPLQKLSRSDIQIAPGVVAAGWSTGGHLALTLAWTTAKAGIPPPDAILSLYCPTDYEDEFWQKPNIPKGSEQAVNASKYRLIDGTSSGPISSYIVPAAHPLTDGWMAPGDARSRIPLHMNWHGKTLHVLLHGMEFIKAQSSDEDTSSVTLTEQEIQSISPLRQIQEGNYHTPTYIIHGTDDDLIPFQQSQRTFEALKSQGVDAQLDIVQDAPHLFDVFYARKEKRYKRIVQAGVEFLRSHV